MRPRMGRARDDRQQLLNRRAHHDPARRDARRQRHHCRGGRGDALLPSERDGRRRACARGPRAVGPEAFERRARGRRDVPGGDAGGTRRASRGSRGRRGGRQTLRGTQAPVHPRLHLAADACPRCARVRMRKRLADPRTGTSAGGPDGPVRARCAGSRDTPARTRSRPCRAAGRRARGAHRGRCSDARRTPAAQRAKTCWPKTRRPWRPGWSSECSRSSPAGCRPCPHRGQGQQRDRATIEPRLRRETRCAAPPTRG